MVPSAAQFFCLSRNSSEPDHPFALAFLASLQHHVSESITSDSENTRLKASRLKSGLTLKQLAERIGYSVGTLSGVENGHDTPSGRLRNMLVDALGINEQWLRTGKGEMHIPDNVRGQNAIEALRNGNVAQALKELDGIRDPASQIQLEELTKSLKEIAPSNHPGTLLTPIEIDVAETDWERGMKDVPVAYRLPSLPDKNPKYPRSILLKRFDHVVSLRFLDFIKKFDGSQDVVEVFRLLHHALPPECANDDFLDHLRIECYLGLFKAVLMLTFGREPGASMYEIISPLRTHIQNANVAADLAARSLSEPIKPLASRKPKTKSAGK